MTLPTVNCAALDSVHTRIKTEDDVLAWKTTSGYKHYATFLSRLSIAVNGVYLDSEHSNPDTSSESVKKAVALLDKLDTWVDEIPPVAGPHRFGNTAFRTWGVRLEEQADSLLSSLLSPTHDKAIPYLKPYILTAFGSPVRLDYGTGHETSFGLFLLSLTLIRFFHPEPEEERQVVLQVFARYLRLTYKLQDTYRLEPAGSHGVWGLDDYCFLPYVFGSAQLMATNTDPSSILALTNSIPANRKATTSALPPNLYTMSLQRILALKRGPFHEHSPQLYSIATGVAKWAKVHSGLLKMYEAEVLGKRVVVQHLPLGGIVQWDPT